MLYNFKLYKAWCTAARECGLELYSKSGGAIRMVDPDTKRPLGQNNNTKHHFFWMLWTPLNKLPDVYGDLEEHGWRFALDGMGNNISDFHIEANKYDTKGIAREWRFDEIHGKPSDQISAEDIVACVKRIQAYEAEHKVTQD